MHNEGEQIRAWRVGDLLVDRARARVTREGAEVPLPKLSFDVLIALLEAAPALLSVDDLMKRVWAGVVVNDETVSQRIKLLRSALGDDARQPRYVAVVRGRGFRIVADVATVDLTGAAVETPAAATPGGTPAATASLHASAGSSPATPRPLGARSSRRRALPLVAIAVAVVVVALAAAWIARTARESATRVNAATDVASANERSIAVLPFSNPGGRSEDEALAVGVAEAVLHQLVGVPEMTVISRTSSFAATRKDRDARQIGAELRARFLLEGSVQRDGSRLRITAQLIDAPSGAHVWSLQFDRAIRDVFAVQDEIAQKVAEALRLSLSADAGIRSAASRTSNFDAYLEYLQARSVMARSRVADLPRAIESLQRSVNLDPRFAPAWASLAQAELERGEYEYAHDRAARFETVLERTEALVERALQIDPSNAAAYLTRARARAFTDLKAAEADYRTGLKLAPSDAAGYEGLASALYQDPARRTEALEALERARRLSPLDPRYEVTRSVFLLYGRSDVAGAAGALERALQLDPLYQPALARLGELNWCCRARAAEGIRYLEQALQLDPQSEWTRRTLILAYLDAGDEAAARATVGGGGAAVPGRDLPLLVYRHAWREAAEAAYAAIDDDTITELYEELASTAIRMDAQQRRDYGRARDVLTDLAGVTWDDAGRPIVERRLGLKSAELGLAFVLQASGQPERGRALAQRVVDDMKFEERQFQRGELWYLRARGMAFAILGDTEGALGALRRSAELSFAQHCWWGTTAVDPAFAEVRRRPEYAALHRTLTTFTSEQQSELARLRANGLVGTPRPVK